METKITVKYYGAHIRGSKLKQLAMTIVDEEQVVMELSHTLLAGMWSSRAAWKQRGSFWKSSTHRVF